jgi:vacuolar-type H+-ATPase subunit F/Vma7
VGAVAVIGDGLRVGGYALAGAAVRAAATAEEAAAAWSDLPEDVACLILTEAAHTALAARLHERPDLVWAVVPD